MGQVREVKPVKFIVGILAISEELLGEARELVADQLGSVDLFSDSWPFTSSKYYGKEMSPTLLRQFVSLAEPGDPAVLIQMKLTSNQVELDDAAKRSRGTNRAINLDPGYITAAKLVLATTKDYSHRVYLDRGIYAEVTLHYHGGTWQAWPWTYPDYAASSYHEFFTQVRSRLLEQLRVAEEGESGEVEGAIGKREEGQ